MSAKEVGKDRPADVVLGRDPLGRDVVLEWWWDADEGRKKWVPRTVVVAGDQRMIVTLLGRNPTRITANYWMPCREGQTQEEAARKLDEMLAKDWPGVGFRKWWEPPVATLYGEVRPLYAKMETPVVLEDVPCAT